MDRYLLEDFKRAAACSWPRLKRRILARFNEMDPAELDLFPNRTPLPIYRRKSRKEPA
jgi:hypothetical protein